MYQNYHRLYFIHLPNLSRSNNSVCVYTTLSRGRARARGARGSRLERSCPCARVRVCSARRGAFAGPRAGAREEIENAQYLSSYRLQHDHKISALFHATWLVARFAQGLTTHHTHHNSPPRPPWPRRAPLTCPGAILARSILARSIGTLRHTLASSQPG